jgi:hypothetical protein
MYVGSTYSSLLVSFPFFFCAILTFHFIHYCAVTFSGLIFIVCVFTFMYIAYAAYVCVHACVCTCVFISFVTFKVCSSTVPILKK